MASIPEQIDIAADALTAEAGRVLAEHGDPKQNPGNSRNVAVQHLATGAVRAATARLAADRGGAGFTSEAELGVAHQLIAELVARLAELTAE
jgi:predicted Zn-dependent protease